MRFNWRCLGGEIDAGKDIWSSVFEPGKGTVPAGDTVIACSVKMNIMLTKVAAILALGFFHSITS